MILHLVTFEQNLYLCLKQLGNSEITIHFFYDLHTSTDNDGDPTLHELPPLPNLPIVDPSDLVWRSFLRPEEDGQRLRVKIVKAIEAYNDDLDKLPTRREFICSTKDDQVEEILTYNEILELLEDQQEKDTIEWRFKLVTSHEGPLPQNHPNYKGSKYNVMIEWEHWEITSEPLSIIAKDDPVTCANYARDNNFLDKAGWTRFKRCKA